MEAAGRCGASIEQIPLFVSKTDQLKARPFLKWAGGKANLLPILRQCVPPSFRCYFEPFLGGGALFFDLCASPAVLSDSNEELMQCYEVVRDKPEELIQRLADLKVSEREFYRIRASAPETLSDIARAARFVYLNKTCYNGLYRVNQKGKFNSPFGGYKNVSLANPDNLRNASKLLRTVTLRCADYREVLQAASGGDFVYLDPPYLPVGKYSDFKRYTKESFYESDHVRLAEEFRRLARAGCSVLLSNSYHPKIAELYSGFHHVTVAVPRFVNCKGGGRGKVAELLISNHPLRMPK